MSAVLSAPRHAATQSTHTRTKMSSIGPAPQHTSPAGAGGQRAAAPIAARASFDIAGPGLGGGTGALAEALGRAIWAASDLWLQRYLATIYMKRFDPAARSPVVPPLARSSAL